MKEPSAERSILQAQDIKSFSLPQADAPEGLEVSFSRIVSDRPLSKRFSVVDGKPAKVEADAPLVAGRAHRVSLRGNGTEIARQFARHIGEYGERDVLVLAAPPNGQTEWRVVTEAALPLNPGAISRTRTYFQPRSGPALLGLDLDVKNYPAFVRERLMMFSERRLQAALASVFPAFEGAALVQRPSTSSGIRNRETGKESGAAGLHFYVPVLDGADIDGFARRLSDHLALAGWAWFEVSQSGLPLYRTLIDVTASRDVSRLFYEGTPILDHPSLELVPGGRDSTVRAGGFLDTRELPELSPTQRQRLEEILRERRERVAAEATEKREAWYKATVARRRPERNGIPRNTLDQAIETSLLEGDFPIILDDGRTIEARDILADPMRFHDVTCADPLEPEYGGGRNKAVIFSNGRNVRIESNAHGGQTFGVVACASDWFEDLGRKPIDVFGDGETSTALALPPDALPPIIERWATDVAARIGTPVAFPALAALVTIAGAIGTKLRIQPKEFDTAWTEPAILWGALVEEPGGKKSPVLAAATSALAAIDAKHAKAGAKLLAEWNDAKSRRGRRPEGKPLPPRPRIRRHVVEGFTVEALTNILADNDHGVLCRQDELTSLITGLDQYKGGKGNDRAMLLSLADGREMRVDRVATGATFVPTWGASVLGAIQPRVIREKANSLDSDGLLQRFIPVLGTGERKRGVDRAPDQAAMANYNKAVTLLAGAEFALPEIITLSVEARRVWTTLEDRIDALNDLAGLSDAWRGHLGKWPGFSARLLLICHVLDNLDDLALVDTKPVTGSTAERAGRLVGWLLANSLRFYITCIGSGEAGDDARWVAGLILARGLSGTITRRELGQAYNPLRDADRAVRCMRFLEANDWCSSEEQRFDRHGPMQWTICPEVHDGRFSTRAQSEKARRKQERQRIEAAARERRALMQESDDGQ